MPIYDLSYRHWEGSRLPSSAGWLPIASSSLMHYMRKRLFLFWMFIAWSPALVFGVFIYLSASVQVENLPLGANAAGFHLFLSTIQYPLYLLTAVFVGSGLVANDRRTNALQIYLSKPIRSADYLLGKGAAVAAAVGLVTLAPSLTLFLFRLGLDKEGGYLTSNFMLPFSILVASVLIMTTLAVLSLTVSSLTKSGRTAGLMLVMLFIFTEAMRGILSLFNREIASLLSPVSNLQQGLDLIFGQPHAYRIHPLVSLLFLAGMLGVCVLVLLRRVRPVEVVS